MFHISRVSVIAASAWPIWFHEKSQPNPNHRRILLKTHVKDPNLNDCHHKHFMADAADMILNLTSTLTPGKILSAGRLSVAFLYLFTRYFYINYIIIIVICFY